MEVTVNTALLLAAITTNEDRKVFERFLNGKDFPGGIQVRLYDRWTSKQQGKLWRDIQKAAGELNLSSRHLYTILKSHEITRDLFRKTETFYWKGTKKEIDEEKGFSDWSKQDVEDGMDIILEFMEYLIQFFHQEVVIFSWSSKINKEDGTTMFEYTGKPYRIGEKHE